MLIKENFKDDVLNLLGINISPSKNGLDPSIQNDKDLHTLTKNSSGRDVTNFINTVVGKMIDCKADKEKDPNKQKSIRRNLEKELKTFTLDDILSRAKGFDIKKGFYEQNTSGYLNRAKLHNYGSNYNSLKGLTGVETIKKTLIPRKKQNYTKNDNLRRSNAITYYLVTKVDNAQFNLKPLSNIEEGDIIIDPKINTNFSESNDFEDCYADAFGGQLNLGRNDAVIDSKVSGENISLKTYIKNPKKVEVSKSVNDRMPTNFKAKVLQFKKIKLGDLILYHKTSEDELSKNIDFDEDSLKDDIIQAGRSVKTKFNY